MRSLLLALALTVPLLAGCATDEAPADEPMPSAAAPPTNVLAGTVEPADVAPPEFTLLGTLARTGPVYGGGEPSIAAALDGTLYVAFPGCDRGAYLANVPGQDTCDHGLVYRSADDGASWQRLNREGDGRYEDEGEGPEANNDAEVTVDSAGTVYASNLGAGGIQVHKSTNGGASWTYLGNTTEAGESADRQWMAAAGPGHLIVAWMGSGQDLDGDDQGRAVVVNTTFDGGATWTGSLALGSGIGWIGPVAFAPDGMTAYIPFTQDEGSTANAVLYSIGSEVSMRVGRTLDGGATWTVLDTGVRIHPNTQGGHWSGVNMAPALDVTGDGTVVVAWSEDVNSPGDLTATGAAIKAVASTDLGATWGKVHDLGRPPTAIQPWVTGGGGDRFALTYYASDVPLDPDVSGGSWNVIAQIVDGIAEGRPQVYATTVETGVHLGPLCSRGSGCAFPVDRSLLDFFESDVTPDGRLVITYPADPYEGGKYIDIRTAIQSGGPLLFERPMPTGNTTA